MDIELYNDIFITTVLCRSCAGEARDRNVFVMWINSLLAIDNGEHRVNDLFADVQNGYTILRVMDRIQPGVVEWERVNINPKNRFKMLENGEYIIDIGNVRGESGFITKSTGQGKTACFYLFHCNVCRTVVIPYIL